MKKLLYSLGACVAMVVLSCAPLYVFAEQPPSGEPPADTGAIGNSSAPTDGAVGNPSAPTGGSVGNPSKRLNINDNQSPEGGFILKNPLSVGTICGLIQKLVNVFLAIGIPIAVLFLVWAGFMFVIARGDPKALIKAKENFTYVIIGIAVFLGAWLMGQIIANTINTVKPGTVSSLSSCN